MITNAVKASVSIPSNQSNKKSLDISYIYRLTQITDIALYELVGGGGGGGTMCVRVIQLKGSNSVNLMYTQENLVSKHALNQRLQQQCSVVSLIE